MATRTGWLDVRQGESIESMAARCGHLPKTIWEAPENGELRQKRKDPHVLMPGDRVFVPAVKPKTFTVATGAKHRFVVELPAPRLKLEVMKEGQARANMPFVLTIDGKEERGTTDGGGVVDHPLPPRARQGTLTVGEGEEATVYQLDLRSLDPTSEVSGLQGRLRNLGYDVGPTDGDLGGRTKAALCAFQRENGIEVTGELDGATRAKLEQEYGC